MVYFQETIYNELEFVLSYDVASGSEKKQHAIKLINHKWFTDFLTLCNDVHYNVA